MDKKTKIKRLTMMYDMLSNHKKLFPKVNFDMEDWIKKGTQNIRGVENGECGTAACAVGSACLYKPFNKMGLKLTRVQNFESCHFVPKYKGYNNWDAVKKFFGLTSYDANHLFSPGCYSAGKITTKRVALRIKNFINELKAF